MAASVELKRIGFIVGAAEASISYLSTKTQPWATRVGALYTTCKDSSSALKPGIVSIESAIQQYGAALVEKSKAAAPKLLQDVDTRVDATLSGVSAALERSLSTVGVSSFNETREQYFTQLEAAMAAVQLRAPHLPAEAYLALRSAISAARSASVESACVMLATVVAAWEAFVAHPTVKEALCKSQLALLLLKKKAIVALRQIHSTHTYAVCEAKARSAVAAVQHHQRFQTYVEPALDSAMQRITSSAYYGRAAEAIKPLMAELQAELEVGPEATPAPTPVDEPVVLSPVSVETHPATPVDEIPSVQSPSSGDEEEEEEEEE